MSEDLANAAVSYRDWGRVHLIAIGGAGMSVIARMLLDRGLSVQGSDQTDSPTLQDLKAAGITVWVGHDARHVKAADTVIVSSAIKLDNPELIAARALDKRVLHRSQALAALGEDTTVIAVAGAHGKTTTSAMIAVGLQQLGLDPSRAVGSSITTSTGAVSGGHSGQDPLMVIEADESDGSFLNYRPSIAVVTNIEPDHLDHYGSVAEFEAAFVSFCDRIVAGGTLITQEQSASGSRLTAKVRELRPDVTIVTCGDDEDNQYWVHNIAVPGDHCAAEADVRAPDGTVVHLRMQVPGLHNLSNATMALASMVAAGQDLLAAAEALTHFLGTGRRFELRGEVAGIRVIDDYAHHPTEVAAILNAARSQVGSGRLLAVFQPHLYSRTLNFAQEFAAALDLADLSVVCDVYGAREAPRTDIGPHTIVDALAGDDAHSDQSRLVAVADKFAAGQYVADRARPSDMIMLLGAGDINTVAPSVLSHLSRRYAQAGGSSAAELTA